LKHFASPEFWFHYRALPGEVQRLADKCFELMKTDPRHPSIHLKQVGEYWSARVGLHYRAVGVDDEGGISWFWIGSHADYDKLIG
jgi:hypothetical protein